MFTQLEITDIYKTSICPLAKVMRRELRARGIESQTVLYSKEVPIKPMIEEEDENYKKAVPGSTAFVPATAGMYIASFIVQQLLNR